MTTTLDAVLRAVTDGPVQVRDITAPRPNEVHCRVAAPDVKDLGDLACRTLGAELILMAADDRRREAGAFFVHYLFAHRTANWFLHASTRLEAAQPELPSLAPFHYPASRFEREIRDLFGILFAGHPDPRPLVKHGFWPDRYYPLRKDANGGSSPTTGSHFPSRPSVGRACTKYPSARSMRA